MEGCDVLLRLLLADGSEVYDLKLKYLLGYREVCINAPTLASLMEQYQSLKVLTLEDIFLDENLCRALGTFSRPGLEIELTCCKLTSAGTSALAEVIGCNQGPTKRRWCEIDYSVLANGLRGNSRLKSLSVHPPGNRDVANQDILAITSALGLVDLHLSHYFTISNEAWYAVCDSLKTHSTLQKLQLQPIFKLELECISQICVQCRTALKLIITIRSHITICSMS